MKSKLNIEKTAQLCCYLIEQCGNDGKITRLKALKLLYLIDRETFARYGFFITGDRYCSMQHGPVLSETYNLIKSNGDETIWAEMIETDSINIRQKKDTNFDLLSKAEFEVINDIIGDYGSFSAFDLVNTTHGFPEWKDPTIGKRSIPICHEEIMANLGYTEPQIKSIVEEAESINSLI